jgi:penicillin-binding protein 1A
MRPIFNAAIAAGMIFAGALGLTSREVELGLPDMSAIVDYHPSVGQIFVPLTAVPQVVRHAFLAAEDDDFYRHGAVDFPMMLRALGLDVLRFDSGRRPLGASTITQQLVKNLIVGDKLSIDRKIREAVLAFRIERRLSKDRILEIYLNEVNLGCHSHGVAEAALNYFSKPVTELSIDEAAFLGGLPKAPSHYNPLRYPDAARSRRNWVIDRMVHDGYVAPGQAATLKAEPLRLGPDHCDRGSGGDEANEPAKVVGVSGDTDRLLAR